MMNKKEIQSLDNESLLAHALGLEANVVKQANFGKRGITSKTVKDYMWTMEEVAKRFNLDLEKLVSKTGSSHWWE